MSRPVRSCTIVLLCVCACAGASVAGAQGAVTAPTRIRITTGGGPRLVGTLASVSSDTLRFTSTDGVMHALPLHAVVRVEESLGRQRRFWKHLALTVAGSGLVAGVLTAATYEPCEPQGFMDCFMAPESQAQAFALGALGGMVIGVPVGIVVGAAARPERWARMEIGPSGLRRVSIRPSGGPGAGVAASYAITF